MVQLFLFPFKRFHLVHTVHLEGGYRAIVLRAIVRGEIETDETVERGGLRERECLWAADVFADKRPDLPPHVSSACCATVRAVSVPVVVLAADADLHLADDTAEELPDGDLEGVYADLVAELDDDPVLGGPAGGEHVAVAGLVEEGGGVLGEGGGGVDPGGAVGGGVVVFAVLRRGGGFIVCGGGGGGGGEGEGRVVGGCLCALPFSKADEGGGGGGALAPEQRPGVGGAGGGERGGEGEGEDEGECEGEPAEYPHRTPALVVQQLYPSRNNINIII